MFKYFIPITLFIADRILKIETPVFDGGFLKFGFYKNYAGAFSLPIAGSLYNIAGVILLLVFAYFFYMSLRALPPAPRSPMGEVGRAWRPTAIATVLDTVPAKAGIAASRTPRNDIVLLAYSFILLGGLSNMIDRFAFGYTIDYVNFVNFSFFNIADVMLLGGIILLLFVNKKRMPPKNSKSQISNPK